MKIIKYLLYFSMLFLLGCGDTPTDTTTTTTPTTTTPTFFPITVTPNDYTMITNSSLNLTVYGGKPPYLFSITSGSGSISSSLGVFNSDSITGNVIIEVKDSVNTVATVKLKIVTPLSLSPSTLNVNINSSYQLQTSGGVPPYTYQIVSGSGSISSIGLFTSNAIPSTSQVKVVDSNGTESLATINVNYPVQILPATVNMNRGDLFQFSATSGFPPYNYRITSGSGSMQALTGVFISPSTPQTVMVEVVDSIGTISASTVTVNNLTLSLDQSIVDMQVGQSFTFKVIGGLAPYTFSFNGSGNAGSLLPTGTYFAPLLSPTTDHIKVIDSEGSIAYATINVNPALSISPNTKVTVVNRAEIFIPSGGIPPYTFSLFSGSGSVNPTNGVFIAPTNPGNAIVRLQDSKGNIVDATVTINPDVLISPLNPKVMVGNQINFLGSGGIPPFQYDIISGPGSIDINGLYTANGGTGTAVIQVKDSKNTTKTTNVYIQSQLQFDEDPIIVKSGNTRNILISGGVPPYTIQFRDPNTLNLTNFSAYGSTVVNNTFTLNPSPLSLQSGSPEVQISRLAHGLIIGDQIQFKSLTSCDVFSAAELNVIATVSSVVDVNNFIITMNKVANNSINCGGVNGFYLKLTGSLPYKAGIVSSQVSETLVVQDSLLNQIEKVVYIDGGLIAQYDLDYANGSTNNFGQGCGSQIITNLIAGNNDTLLFGCPDSAAWFLQETRTSPLSAINYVKTGPVALSFDLPFNKTVTESNSFELWIRWDGVRLSSSFSRMDANIIGLSNQNISFMSIKTGSSSYDRALCFNTKTTNPYDCYGIRNVDSLIADRWTHLVFIVNNGDITKNKIYINGVSQSLTNVGSGASNSVSQTNNLVVLGSSFIPITNAPPDINSSSINSKLSFIKMFNRALTSDEITNSYNNTKSRYQDFTSTP